jgi:phytoene desaturase
MIYLGLDTIYNEPHHQIIFAHDYHRNITEISYEGILSKDLSLYIRNGSLSDTTLAPKGHSALYILVPVPNLLSDIVWDDEKKAFYREKILTMIEQRTSMTDLRRHITAEHVITPYDWQTKLNIFKGATFNLSHNLLQMLYFRPHNRFQECHHCYLAGGGTHPGSGLPTIYESARITAELITEDFSRNRK